MSRGQGPGRMPWTRGRSLPASGALLLAVGGVAAPGTEPAPAQTVVVEAEMVRTGSPQGTLGPSTIVVEEGRVTAILPRSAEPPDVPPDARLLSAAVVLPGLVDARTTAGLAGLHPTDDEADETSGPLRPEARAADAFDLSEPLIRQALRDGTTVVQATPGNRNSVGGQAAVFRTSAPTLRDGLLRSSSGMVISLVEAAKETYAAERRVPTTRMGNMALIRQALLDASHYARRDEGGRDLGHEAMADVLEGRTPALIAADRRDEIAGALRLTEEFNLRSVVVGGRESAPLARALSEAEVPVLLVPPREAIAGEERPEEIMGGAAQLSAENVPFALASGARPEGPSLLDWAVEVSRHGLSPSDALEAVTRTPARILGLDGEMGSVEEGKLADLVLLDADPFDGPYRVTAVLLEGRVSYELTR